MPKPLALSYHLKTLNWIQQCYRIECKTVASQVSRYLFKVVKTQPRFSFKTKLNTNKNNVHWSYLRGKYLCVTIWENMQLTHYRKSGRPMLEWKKNLRCRLFLMPSCPLSQMKCILNNRTTILVKKLNQKSLVFQIILIQIWLLLSWKKIFTICICTQYCY